MPKSYQHDNIYINLYGNLWFGTNERVLLRRRYPTIGSLRAPITTTKGEGYYVEFFLYVPSPWSRSQKRKGNRGINKDKNRRIVLFLNSLDFLCEMGAWKILPEHSPGMSLV